MISAAPRSCNLHQVFAQEAIAAGHHRLPVAPKTAIRPILWILHLVPLISSAPRGRTSTKWSGAPKATNYTKVDLMVQGAPKPRNYTGGLMVRGADEPRITQVD